MTLAAIQKLKKRLRELERKEAQSRKKLASAMHHAEKIAKAYQSRLKSAFHELKLKDAYHTALACARAAYEMECKVLKKMQEKGKAMMSAAKKMSKDSMIKSVKNTRKRAKKK